MTEPTARESILSDYDVDSHGIIRTSGKFEAEMLYVPLFWEATLDGSADQLDWADGTTTYLVDVSDEDRAMFPEIPADVVAVHLEESEQGFVSCETLTEQERADLEARNGTDESEDDESEDDDSED